MEALLMLAERIVFYLRDVVILVFLLSGIIYLRYRFQKHRIPKEKERGINFDRCSLCRQRLRDDWNALDSLPDVSPRLRSNDYFSPESTSTILKA